MTGRRGALPLALLIFGALIAGVVVAVVRVGEDRGPGKAVESPSPDKTAMPTGEPTETPTEKPTKKPTEEPTEEPTGEPTGGPNGEPTEEPSPGGGGGPGTPTDGPTPLAKTGGEASPWMVLGALLVGLSAVLGRLARRPS